MTFSPPEPVSSLPARSGFREADIVLGMGCLGLAVGCALSPAKIGNGPIICPFRALTGLPCPGCGMTRSWVYLTHGWWREALAANALGVALALAVVLLTTLHVARRMRSDAGSGGVDVIGLAGARSTMLLLWAPWLVYAVGRMTWYGFTGATY